MEEVVLYGRAAHSPRTSLLNAMRHLTTNAQPESQEAYARSIFTLARALVELSVAGRVLDELRRRSPRIQMNIAVLFVWSEGKEEHRERSFTISVSRFGCALHSHRFLEPGSNVELEHEGKRINGKVVYSLKDHSRKLVEIGLGFDRDGIDFWGASVPELERPAMSDLLCQRP